MPERTGVVRGRGPWAIEDGGGVGAGPVVRRGRGGEGAGAVTVSARRDGDRS